MAHIEQPNGTDIKNKRGVSMNTMEELKKYIISELSVDFGKNSVDPEENLLTQGIIDSMGILKLVSFMENKFGIKINNEDIVPENFQTINDLKVFVENKIKK
jgi:acyl carrier protein